MHIENSIKIQIKANPQQDLQTPLLSVQQLAVGVAQQFVPVPLGRQAELLGQLLQFELQVFL